MVTYLVVRQRHGGSPCGGPVMTGGREATSACAGRQLQHQLRILGEQDVAGGERRLDEAGAREVQERPRGTGGGGMARQLRIRGMGEDEDVEEVFENSRPPCNS